MIIGQPVDRTGRLLEGGLMQNVDRPRFETQTGGSTPRKIFIAGFSPVLVFMLSLYTVYTFLNFGKLLVAPLLGVMWAFGAFVAFYLRSQRKEVIRQTLIAVTLYCCLLLGLRVLVGLTSNVTGEMFAATFSQPLPTVSANTIPGYLQNALYAAAALFPLSFLGLQLKRLIQFKRNANKMKTLQRIRGYRE